MKYLKIGDLHIQDGNIDETDRIFDYIVSTVIPQKKIDAVILLGDAWHCHNIVKQTVCDCIKRNITKLLSTKVKVYYVVGNHDNENPRGGPVNSADLIIGHMDVTISGFTGYKRIGDSDVYIVGFRHQDMFVETCNKIYAENPNSIIIHHQTVDGSKYESGMPAIGGIPAANLPNKMFIGGHVHTKQSFGKFIYLGSPRALTFSDVNQDKGVHVFDDETLTFEFISLNHITKSFYSFDILETEYEEGQHNMTPTWKAGDDVKIHIHGSSDFYKKFCEINKGLQTANLGKVSFIPHVKKIMDSKVDSKQVETDIYKAFEGYVFNTYNAEPDMKGKIWDQMEILSKQVGA
jgi:DNA repair exonuclease SbcCD nuclease subunit